MSKFEVLIEQVQNVRDHPNADRLSLLDINGFTCISAKLEDGSHRYRDGDPVAYIPEGAVLPEWLLKAMDFWDDEKGKGRLNGSKGDRIKAMRLRGILSLGVVLDPTKVFETQEIDGEICINITGLKLYNLGVCNEEISSLSNP